MHTAWYWWALFFILIAGLLIADLGLFQRKTHALSMREALRDVGLRVALALGFNVCVYLGLVGGYPTEALQHKAGLEFFTGYLIEFSLSMDNIFVFAVVFKFFKVPSQYQYRVLFWGIVGALVMRAILIFIGLELFNNFSWIIYVFAAILIFSGFKMMFGEKETTEMMKNPVLKFFRRFVPVSDDFDNEKFFTIQNGHRMATPLCVALFMIEMTDLLFAVDSIPAVLAVTTDPFIVFTSNIFAILGLRALYFALASILELFHYLHYGLAAILIFVGVKMSLAHSPWAFDILTSLIVIAVLLFGSIGASLIWAKKKGVIKI